MCAASRVIGWIGWGGLNQGEESQLMSLSADILISVKDALPLITSHEFHSLIDLVTS